MTTALAGHAQPAPTPSTAAGFLIGIPAHSDRDGYTTPPPKTHDGYGKTTPAPTPTHTTSTAPAPTLPVTGDSVAPAMGLGVGLVAVGAALFYYGVRYRPTHLRR